MRRSIAFACFLFLAACSSSGSPSAPGEDAGGDALSSAPDSGGASVDASAPPDTGSSASLAGTWSCATTDTGARTGEIAILAGANGTLSVSEVPDDAGYISCSLLFEPSSTGAASLVGVPDACTDDGGALEAPPGSAPGAPTTLGPSTVHVLSQNITGGTLLLTGATLALHLSVIDRAQGEDGGVESIPADVDDTCTRQ